MKLDIVNSFEEGKKIHFQGKRIFRNTVSQLAKNNPYSLTEPNQRAISNAIIELGKIPKLENVKFLLNTAAKSTYSTRFITDDAPINDWRSMLIASAVAAVALIPNVPNWVTNKIEEIKRSKNLSEIEKEILTLKEQLTSTIDTEQIKRETVGGIRDFKKNLNYFIVSSETTLEHKKYVLERLNYFMSDKYEINPQLKNKKSIAVAEMINDMAIHTPGNAIPNIKSVNQKQHGICAAISIVRKKLAYEDKPNYVDSIISELDSSSTIEVYDRNHLGTGKKTYVEKIPVDFDTALANGYRIIDASTMHWMQIAQMTGASNIAYDVYNPFDKENFDVNNDSFYNVRFEDPELEKAQTYYQSLVKAKDIIENYKASKIKSSLKNEEIYLGSRDRIEELAKISNLLHQQLTSVLSNANDSIINQLIAGLTSLECAYSDQIKKDDIFSYIPNEEDCIKKEKIKNFILRNSDTKEISPEAIDKIFDTIEYYNNINSSNKIEKTKPISRARNLYEIAASFRFQMIKGLEEPKTLENIMLREGLTNRENLLLKTIDILIEKLEKNSPHSNLIIEQVAPLFDGLQQTKEDTIEGLNYIKETVNSFLTDDLDDIYGALLYGNRRTAIYNYLSNAQELLSNGNYKLVESYSEILGCKKNKDAVINRIESLKKQIIEGNENEYNKIFTMLGNISQIDYISKLYEETVKALGSEDNSEAVLGFLQVNNLSIEDNENAVIERLEQIKNKINQLNVFISNCIENLKIRDQEGDILFSADPKDIIIKKLENEFRIVPAKNLRIIQEHLEKITKDRSQDEFQSRQGKLKDKSLNIFSKQEKQTLKEIESMINPMYAYIQKQLNYVQSDLKPSLEELKRLIGLNSGDFWIQEEGSSGLAKNEQVRVLEYMTGRPHYITSDFKKAINIIKTTPYSGITGSSVFHDRAGMHAQYVADIEPVKVHIKEKDGTLKEEIKDVLFQDNTWGASELENTWIDSFGLKRTDYSDNRGGSLGYITNDKLRNGNFVERILNDMVTTIAPDKTNSKVYKKIKHPSTEAYSFPQYTEVILDGSSPDTKSLVDSIHDALFVSPKKDIEDFIEKIKGHSIEELKAMIKSVKLANKNWENTFDELYSRIFPPFGNGIQTLEEYNKLSNNDPLKVALEKVAIKKTYQIAGLEPAIALAKDTKELSKYRTAQKNRAINSFKYAFGKNLSALVDYVSNAFSESDNLKLISLIKKYNPNATDEQIDAIGEKFEIDIKKYDGSIKTAIQLIIESITPAIEAAVVDQEGREKVKEFFSKFLHKTLYFNSSDLNNKKISHLIKFIDREFDPLDNEEFIKIYRKIQNMTNEEFKEKILSKAMPKDMDLTEISGFDVLKKIQKYDENFENALRNTIYYDGLVKDGQSESYTYEYKLDKLTRTPKYKPNKNFNSLYNSLQNDLSLLTLHKLFNQYKDRNITKYGAFPAYPKLDYIGNSIIENNFDIMMNVLKENTTSIRAIGEQIINYEIAHELLKITKKIKDNTVLNEKQYTNINKLLGEFITLNLGDTSIEDILEAAENAMELPLGSTWTQYKPYINMIIKRLSDFENTTSKEILQEVEANKKSEIRLNKKVFALNYVQKRYQNHIIESLNQIEQALIKRNYEKAEELENKLYEDFKKYHILQDPSDLLEQFILSNANNTELEASKEIYYNLLLRGLNYAKLSEIQELLMIAVKKGVAINAKKLFNNYSINLFGTSVSMGSDEIIAYMINSLIIDNQKDTALLFLDKLGLADTFIRQMHSQFDFDEIRKIIINAHKIVNDFNLFKNNIEPVFSNIGEELKDDTANFNKIMNSTKKQIKHLGKKYNIDEKYLDILYQALNNIRYTCNENPNAQKGLIFSSVISIAKEKMANAIKSDIETQNDILRANASVLELINQILLPANSESYLLREEINKEFKEIHNLKQKLVNLQAEQNSDKI